MIRRRQNIFSHFHETNFCNLSSNFCCGKNSSVTGLCTLRKFYLDHFYIRKNSALSKFFIVESSVRISAAEISGTNLPDNVSARFEVIRTQSAFTRIMCKASKFRSAIQSHDCIFAERTKTHSRNIQNTRRIWLLAIRPPNHNTRIVINAVRIERSNGMIQPFVADFVNIQLRSERSGIVNFFRALINYAAVLTVERSSISV